MKFQTLLTVASANLVLANDLLAKTADSWIRNNQETQRAYWYGRAVVYEGIEATVELTKNKTLLAWYREQMDDVVSPNGTIINYDLTKYSLDNYRIGMNLLYWYKQTGDDKYKIAADFIRDRINQHPRTPTGGFWHRSPTYPDQMWLDGIFMCDSFYAEWTAEFDAKNTTAWDDIVLQWDKIQEVTIDKETGLPVHGFDESKTAVWADPKTGASPIVWSRAVGWYIWSLIEVLDVFPKSHPGYKRLVTYYKDLSSALLRAQGHESHLWELVMNKQYEGVEGNYIESSASAMFTYGWLAGLRRGLLDEKTYTKPAKEAYKRLIRDFVTKNNNGTITWEGTVEVGSLNSDASFEYYTEVPVVPNDTRGMGPFMMAIYEWEVRNK
ncbi:Six-hairpin glycosidase-like protein [Fusarium redolens]|uniref:Six-hairpin glycosidase-like protein n=1 Tax=Fusarium redolens TaxID=48865 RepID=A0A9P9JVM5_FUSRE|nr:Six-hairpin glycosidase-like protein [Fusarium redolens]KAH7230489.1 Six-hairpin glycosidase-like protein [Fusarium redolens]